MTDTRLLADIGGTNARFGWQDGRDDPITHVRTLACSSHASLIDAIRCYLLEIGRPAPLMASMAIATPINGDQVKMTNHHWSFSSAHLKETLGLRELVVLNDFSALALALPALRPSDLMQVGGAAAVAGRPLALIGPGTGLGVSGLIPVDMGTQRCWVPLASEGGHASVAPQTAREQAVLAKLAEQFGHVSGERVVSGPGLECLYDTLAAMDGRCAPRTTVTAAEITRLALAGDRHGEEALELFCGFLGSMAGNLALTLGAQGGVYIGGGIVPRLGSWFSTSSFRSRFEYKGRFASYLAAIPVFVICAETSPALLGAASALQVERSSKPLII